MAIAPTICARTAWSGNSAECRRLYRQYQSYFSGSFAAIRAYYGWTRKAMLNALRQGRAV